MTFSRPLPLLCLLFTLAALPTAAAPAKIDLDLDSARRVAEVGAAKARELGSPGGAIAVVDAAGQPLFVMRLDGSFPIASEVAIGKARTAALFARPTRVLEDSINQGRPALLAVLSQPGVTPLRGGVPLLHEGRLVGAVGVSGAASAAQDEDIAMAAAAGDALRMADKAKAPVRTGEVAIAPELPDAIADLRTSAGAALVAAQWSYRDAEIVAAEHHEPGPDKKATGAPNRTHDLSPRHSDPQFLAGFANIAADDLETRRGHGRLGFGWYHLELTLPEKLGNLPVAGATAVFELVVDDVAEIWVNGELPQVLGQRGGQLAAGWNTPNRVVLSRAAKPGEKFALDILALNAPLSEPPANYVWIRSATLDLYAPGRYTPADPVPLAVRRLDPAIAAVLPEDPVFERVATGFTFTEGPVWQKESGSLLFSDPNRNVIYRLDGDRNVSIYRTKSGYTGADIGEYRQPGSNGLGIDPDGRLLIAEHGNRRISRLERNGSLTVLADRFEGKRLNSPNDLVQRGDGAIFFSDPPFGLPQFHADPRREVATTGVYCLLPNGRLEEVVGDLSGPNGVAFSPDQRYLYVGNWDEKKKVVMRYEVTADCAVQGAKVFFDLTAEPGEEAIDGVEVDTDGRLYISGPGGLWVVSPEGKALAALRGPEQPANFAWGEDGHTLFWTARTSVYRLRLESRGFR